MVALKKIYSSFYNTRFFLVFLFLAAIVLIAIYLNFHSPNIPDPDGFYHYRHASIYATEGIWQKDFPWTQFSVIGRYQADIWYGFHILLIPFTFADSSTTNPIFGIKLASVFSTVAAFLISAWAFWRLDRSRFPLWFFIFITSSASLLFRLIMLRPHPISLALSLLLLSFLVAPVGAAVPLFLFFILGFLFSWLHLALGWLPVLVYIITVGFTLVINRSLSFRWREGVALFLGLALGVLLRPNPLGALKIAYVQVVQFFLEKQSELPIQFGGEMLRLNFGVYIREVWPLAVLFLFALVFLFFAFKNKARRPNSLSIAVLISSFSLSAIFLILAIFVASRSFELSLGFALIFLIIAIRESVFGRRALVVACAAFLIIVQIWVAVPRFNFFMRNTAKPETLKASSLWLRENSEPKSIVFNPHWDNFAQSFFWNQNNYYINGMDPIFEYSYSPELYWKTHYYAVGIASDFTCGETACSKEMASTTEEVLRNDFHASYVVLQKRRTPKFYGYLNGAAAYEKVFENSEEAVFKIAR